MITFKNFHLHHKNGYIGKVLLDSPTTDNINFIINELKNGHDNVSLSFENSNYLDTLTSVKSIKSIVKKEVNFVKFRVFGRGNRKQSFKQIGRVWWNSCRNKNDVSLNSAAGYFMNSFTLYFYLGR